MPLEAVLRGIDAAFEKWRGRKVKTQMVNSLAFCAQAVLTEAQIMAGSRAATAAPRGRAAVPARRRSARVPGRRIAALRARGLRGDRRLAGSGWPTSRTHYHDLEALEQRLTVLEEKMIAAARARQSEEDLLAARRELDRQLRPYRGKMTADQLAMLEKQYLERILLEKAGLPRLSLFYMR